MVLRKSKESVGKTFNNLIAPNGLHVSIRSIKLDYTTKVT
ncbi:MAG: hypothetical protein KatS3mg035_1054 [Bacteroidia bacterium]|nr:MAG: hypothetical protein KatS3mg035_1054 [Bacteroidia bacterium]